MSGKTMSEKALRRGRAFADIALLEDSLVGLREAVREAEQSAKCMGIDAVKELRLWKKQLGQRPPLSPAAEQLWKARRVRDGTIGAIRSIKGGLTIAIGRWSDKPTGTAGWLALMEEELVVAKEKVREAKASLETAASRRDAEKQLSHARYERDWRHTTISIIKKHMLA